jgi:uncharacterized Zn-finger protein
VEFSGDIRNSTQDSTPTMQSQLQIQPIDSTLPSKRLPFLFPPPSLSRSSPPSSDVASPTPEMPAIDTRVSCTQCPKEFSSRKVLKRHYADIRPFPCKTCSKSCKRIQEAVQHGIGCEKRTYALKAGIVKEFKCPLCPRSFSAKHNYKRHITTHSETPYICTTCPKSYRTAKGCAKCVYLV